VPNQGDCIDCFQCVQVCPTGVDIRQGQQLGCITCGLCIDACDSVMDKIAKPRGLIRYASHDEMEGAPKKGLSQRPSVLVYFAIIIISLVGIVYGLVSIEPVTVTIRPERQPMFVQMSDGSIQNKYELKVLNKTDRDQQFEITVSEGVKGQVLIGTEQALTIPKQKSRILTVFVRAPIKSIGLEASPITFRVRSIDQPEITVERQTKFNAPKQRDPLVFGGSPSFTIKPT
jgi:cytochrome c oxidase accessory protein FixG